jgi:hypothetical protein
MSKAHFKVKVKYNKVKLNLRSNLPKI